MTAKRCREIRASLGVTQEEFAALLGTSRTTVSRWETDERRQSHSRITEPMSRLIERVAMEVIAKRRK